MASLGTLAVNIVARTEKFTAGITKSIGMTQKFASVAGKTVKVFAGIGAAATAAGLAITTRYVSALMESIDATVKSADQIGIATEKLVGLQHAAGLAGVDTTALHKSLVNMNRRLAEATLGSGEASATLQRLGLDANALTRMTPEEAFIKIGDTLNKLPTQAAKAKAAFDLFGRGGVSLLSLTQSGGESIRELMADAETLGKTYNRAQGAAVEGANDAISRTKEAFSGLFTQLTVQLAPAIKTIADTMTEWLVNARQNLGSLIGTSGGVVGAIGTIADVVQTVGLGFMKLQAIVTRLFANVASVISDAVGFAIKQINKIPGVEIENPQMIDAIADSLNAKATELENSFSTAFQADPPSEKIKAFFEQAQAQAEEAAKSIEKVTKPKMPSKLEKLGGSLFGGLGTAFEKVTGAKKAADAAVMSDALSRLTFGAMGNRLPVAKAGDAMAKAIGPKQELTARTAGDLDTYAAARRNLGDGTKTQVDIAKKQLQEAKETRKLLAKQKPQVFTLAGVA